MADALISPAVGAAMYAAAVGGNAYAVIKIKNDENAEKKIPLMGVMGAFAFAAQMVNFTIPLTGSSGHIGGGALLAALIGGAPALLAVTCVLIIQCLFFADGGLLALGCNIFNMGVIPCLIVYPLIYRPILGKRITSARLTVAAIVSAIIGLQLGAFGVVTETLASGVTALPFAAFAALMLPVHLAIGIAEGVITAAVLCFVNQTRPEILRAALNETADLKKVSVKKTVIVFALAAVLIGGALSLFASRNPDGLEWAIFNITGETKIEANGETAQNAAAIQETTAFMPDYAYSGANEEGAGTSAAGVIGAAMTFSLAAAVAFIISAVKKQNKNTVKPNV